MTCRAAIIRPPIPSEHAEASALWQWAQLQAETRPPLARLYHIPNEGKRRRGAAGRLAAEGLQSGVSDYVLPVACGAYHGAYLELKRQDGGELARRNRRSVGLTANQGAWLSAMAGEGYAACVAWGWDAARAWLLAYLDLPPGRPMFAVDTADPQELRPVGKAVMFARTATECSVIGDWPHGEGQIRGGRR
jgi:hypothetical protein